MSDIERVAILIAPLFAFGFLALIIRWHWPGRDSHLDEVPGWWPYGDGLWRAWRRSLPSSSLAFAVMSVVAFVGTVFPVEESPVFTAFALLGASSIPLWVSVILFNRPRFLVAPRWRQAPGLLADWWRGYRSRREGAER